MNRHASDVDSIEEWRRKILNISSSSTDRLGSVTLRTLELVDRAMHEDITSENVQCALETLAPVRNVAMKFDNERDSPTHQMIYALTKSIQLLIGSMIDKNQCGVEMGGSKFVIPKDEPLDTIISSDRYHHSTGEGPSMLADFTSEMNGSMTEQADVKPEFLPFDVGAMQNGSVAGEISSLHEYTTGTPHTLTKKRKLQQEPHSSYSRMLLACPKCEYLGKTVTGLDSHLRKMHDGATMRTIGIRVECACGVALGSETSVRLHRNTCTLNSFTIVERSNVITSSNLSTPEARDDPAISSSDNTSNLLSSVFPS